MYHQAVFDEPIILDLKGRRTIKIPLENQKFRVDIPEMMKRGSAGIGDREEFSVIRHYVKLSEMNFGADSGFYPLGSCTMKYNPKINDEIAVLEGFRMIHPLQDSNDVQGALKLLYELAESLKIITGMDEMTLQPLAGAGGEFTGLSIVRAYFECTKQLDTKTEVVVPDSAHGSNPASSHMAGFDVVQIPSAPDGTVDIEKFKEAVTEKTAAFMITNPNTLGIFEDKILEMANYAHSKGALLYYDGANLNGIMTKTTPAKMGFDIVHLNLHKTFSTPHGGGGPGAGPVGVVEKLKDFLLYAVASVVVIAFSLARKSLFSVKKKTLLFALTGGMLAGVANAAYGVFITNFGTALTGIVTIISVPVSVLLVIAVLHERYTYTELIGLTVTGIGLAIALII